MIDVIKQVATQCFIPFTAGGGIRTIDDIHNLLKAGVDKIAINTAAVENPDFIRKAAQKFGDQCIVVSIDAKKKEDGTYEVYTQGGKKATGLNPVEWAKEAEKLNAGEILITSIDCEGMMGGYDIQLIREVSDAISIPVIAHGGVGTLQHLVEGLREGKASAVAAASIFHFTDQSPIKARRFMKEAGIDVRTTF
jgi:cyclase